VQWLPFDLHPEYPPGGIPRAELHARYGGDRIETARRVIESAGFRYDPPPVVPNSRKALEVSELARDRALHAPVHTRLMRAYWSEAADIGDEPTLLDLAAEAGLDRNEAAEAISARTYAERVDASTREAQLHGIHAIPAFVLDRRLVLLGAQPREVFERAFEQLAAEEVS
jgi:predicted DsbA family dithiol-disulfide isomerase